ncbi:MAG: YfbK domain-containing protein [Gammaproteobacteria bacterium]
MGQAPAREFSQPVFVPADVGAGSDDLRFAAAVAGFGELLRGGRYQGEWSQADAARLARSALGRDSGGWRAEFVRLVQLADSLDTPRSLAHAAAAAVDDTANGGG